METISVIIPTFNREKMLYRALESVVNQKNVDTEIIVVDDGSSDKTEQMIKRNFHEIKYLKQNNRGVSSARNLGIINATGNFIALLDSDDEWKISKLEKQLDFLQNNQKFNAVHCNEKWFNGGREIGQKKYHDRSSTGLFKRSLRRCLISPSSILVRKELFKRIGNFDESLPACEDYDFWLRVLVNEDIGHISEVLVFKFGGHSDQLSKKIKYLDLYRLKSLYKLLKQKSLSDSQMMLILKEINFKRQIIFTGAKKHNNHDVLDRLSRIQENVL